MEQYGALKIAWRAVKIPFFKNVISSLKRMSKFMYFSNATENFVLHGSR